jgi:hypothetical protein
MSQYIFDNRAVHQARQRFDGLETVYDPATCAGQKLRRPQALRSDERRERPDP